MATLKEIVSRLDLHEQDVQAYRAEQTRLTGMLFQQLENIETHLGSIATELADIKDKVRTYDSWVDRAKGALWPVGVACLVIWFLIKDRVRTFFGVSKD